MITTKILCLTAAALLAAVTNGSSVAAQPVPETLSLGTTGGSDQPTVVTYTCAKDKQVCGPFLAPPGRWSQTVVVPRGTMVYLNVRWDRAPAASQDYGEPADPAALPNCWIKNAAGTTLAGGSGTCIYQAPPGPLPAAPPSG